MRQKGPAATLNYFGHSSAFCTLVPLGLLCLKLRMGLLGGNPELEFPPSSSVTGVLGLRAAVLPKGPGEKLQRRARHLRDGGWQSPQARRVLMRLEPLACSPGLLESGWGKGAETTIPSSVPGGRLRPCPDCPALTSGGYQVSLVNFPSFSPYHFQVGDREQGEGLEHMLTPAR